MLMLVVLWCILLESHLCYLILDLKWTFVFLSLSLSLCEIAFIFNSDMFVLHLTISSNFAIWLDLIPLISYNWSLTFFFSQNKSHTYNFTTIPKRHLNPNPKKRSTKSFNEKIPRKASPLWAGRFPIHQPHQGQPTGTHPEKKTQFSSSCSSKATALKKLPDPGVEDHAPKRRKSIVTRPQNAWSRFAVFFLMGEINVDNT